MTPSSLSLIMISVESLRMKKDLRSLDPTELDFPENTKKFINESLCPYYTISGLILVKLEETGPSRIITHVVDLKELFPDVDIENL